MIGNGVGFLNHTFKQFIYIKGVMYYVILLIITKCKNYSELNNIWNNIICIVSMNILLLLTLTV